MNFPLNKMKIQLMNLMLILRGWPWPNCLIFIRNDMFVNKSIVELSKLNEMLKAFMLDSRIEETKPSTSKHLRRKLENEFKDTLHIIQTKSNKVIVCLDNLTRDELALICFKLEKEVTLLRQHPGEVGDMEVAHIATQVRQ